MWLNGKWLRRLNEAKKIGFVLENEPNFRGYLRCFHPRVRSFLGVTDEHGRGHGRSRTCRERMSLLLYKGGFVGPEKTWKRGRGFVILWTVREASAVAALGVFNNSWRMRPKYL